MKRSDALPSASATLPAEVGAADSSGIEPDFPLSTATSTRGSGRSLTWPIWAGATLDWRLMTRLLVLPQLAEELGVSRSTLYRYDGPGGELREHGARVLGEATQTPEQARP